MKNTSKLKTVSLFLSVCLLIVASFFVFGGIKASETNKAVIDVRLNNPKSAALHLKLIHQSFKERDTVVMFSGPSVKLISKDREGFSAEENKLLDEISSAISEMSKDGIKLEVCLVAARVFGVDQASILEDIKHVENGWLSIVDYQANGYYLVPAY
ncbi:MAG: DsrE family protein [bacterium]|nr:MAG: DsrE family protein [bacterium]